MGDRRGGKKDAKEEGVKKREWREKKKVSKWGGKKGSEREGKRERNG